MLYPIVTESRMVMELNGVWQFRIDNGKGFEEKWYASRLEDAQTMPVPSSYNDMKEDSELRDHYGWVFYQRPFSVPGAMGKDRIMMRFDAVTHYAVVYLNGKEIVRHKGGFLPFEVEIDTNQLLGENLLTVAVDNRIDHSTLPVGSENQGGSMLIGGVDKGCRAVRRRNRPNFDFFNYCGITRPVRIYSTPREYISDVTLVSELSGPDAEIRYEISVAGNGKTNIEVCDESGNPVAGGEGREGVLKVRDARLWQPLKPYLYNVKISCGDDVYRLPFGIRTVSVDGGRFLINGRPFYFKGYGKHEDTFPAGRGLNEPMNVKDISLLKWQGANSIRTSHYPYSEEMMRLCDREGIVVIDETPGVGIHLNFGGGANFKDGKRIETFAPEEEGGIRTFGHHMDVVKDLVSRDKNYACVVMWSIANEADSAGPGAYDYFKPLFDKAHELDPQKRPRTIVGMQVEDNSKDCTLKLSDVYCLNRYYGWYVMGGDMETAEKLMREEMEFWNGLGKPVIITEYGADTVSGFHDTVPVMFTEEYQIEYYRMNNRVLDEFENFVGEHAWNFADFATSQGVIRVQGNKKGIFTRERRPKMVAHYFKERWNRIPSFGYKKPEKS